MGQDVSQESKPQVDNFMNDQKANPIHSNDSNKKNQLSPKERKNQLSPDSKSKFKSDQRIIMDLGQNYPPPPKLDSPIEKRRIKNNLKKDQQQSPEKIQSSPNKLNKDQKDGIIRQMNDRMIKYNEQKELQLEKLRKEAIEREMYECTFAPSVNQETQQIRSPEEFQKYQNEFINKKQEKIRALKIQQQQVQEELAKQFEMNKQSKELVKAYKNGDFYQRLISKQNELELKLKKQRAKLTEMKQINPTNSKDERKQIQLRLYKKKSPKDNNLSIQTKSDTKNDKTQKSDLIKLKSKLLKEFNHQITQLGLDDKIQKNQIIELLFQMGFIQEVESESNNNNKLIQDLWNLINQDGQVTTKSQLFEVLLEIQGIGNKKQQLHQHYYTMYLNRLLRIQTKNKKSKQQDLDSKLYSSFQCLSLNTKLKDEISKAQIKQSTADSEYTEQLADKYRGKVLEEYKKRLPNAQGELTYEEYLDFSSKNLQQKIAIIRAEQSTNQLKECTFKPNISQFHNEKGQDSSKHPINNLGPIKRSELLAQNNHPHNIPRDPIQIEWEKNKNDCTFTPIINKYSQPKGNIQIHNYEETVERLRSARQVQENVQKFLARGEQNYHQPNRPRPSAPVRNSSQEQYQQRANSAPRDKEEPLPILYVDVTFNNQVQRISLYQNDNLNNVAEIFLKTYNISMDYKQSLIKLLMQHLENYYDKNII